VKHMSTQESTSTTDSLGCSSVTWTGSNANTTSKSLAKRVSAGDEDAPKGDGWPQPPLVVHWARRYKTAGWIGISPRGHFRLLRPSKVRIGSGGFRFST